MSFAHHYSHVNEVIRQRAERARAAEYPEGVYRRILVKQRNQLLNELALMPHDHAKVPDREKKLNRINKRIATVDKVLKKRRVRWDEKKTKKEKRDEKEIERAKKGLKKRMRRNERERRAKREGKITPRRAVRMTFYGALTIALAPVAIGIASVGLITIAPVWAIRKHQHQRVVRKNRKLANKYNEASRVARPMAQQNDKAIHLSPVAKVNKAIGDFGKSVKGIFVKGKR